MDQCARLSRNHHHGRDWRAFFWRMAMADSSIEAGDVVELKSGGPKVTVSEPGKDDASKWLCQWFDANNLKTGEFAEPSLKKVP